MADRPVPRQVRPAASASTKQRRARSALGLHPSEEIQCRTVCARRQSPHPHASFSRAIIAAARRGYKRRVSTAHRASPGRKWRGFYAAAAKRMMVALDDTDAPDRDEANDSLMEAAEWGRGEKRIKKHVKGAHGKRDQTRTEGREFPAVA